MTEPGEPGLSLDDFFYGHSKMRMMIIAPRTPWPELPPALAALRHLEHVQIIVMVFGPLPSLS